jgi:hypothetical protein
MHSLHIHDLLTILTLRGSALGGDMEGQRRQSTSEVRSRWKWNELQRIKNW